MGDDPFIKLDARRILVADDDPILREFAVAHLATPDTMVETAADGVAALSLMQASAPDIALIDLDMPRMDGFELITRLRADPRLAHLPVIVVTGREDTAAIDRAFEAGATSFTVKPLNWRLLTHQLAYVLRAARTEGELRIAHERSRRADAVKTNLLRIVRHEFNTPFNAILGFGKLVEAHSSDAAARSHAAHILTAAGGLKAILDRMHLAGRAMAGEIEPETSRFGCADLLKTGTRGGLAGKAIPGEAVRVSDRTGNVEIQGDWRLLVTALAGLVDNACRHGAPPLAVTASIAAGGLVEICVRDSGPGLPETALNRVLDPFEQEHGALNRPAEGIGLGLPLTKALAELHGGTLQLRAAVGGGLDAVLSFRSCGPVEMRDQATRDFGAAPPALRAV